jgi:hypothetical protein
VTIYAVSCQVFASCVDGFGAANLETEGEHGWGCVKELKATVRVDAGFCGIEHLDEALITYYYRRGKAAFRIFCVPSLSSHSLATTCIR